MKIDLFAAYPCREQGDIEQINKIEDIYTRIQLLSEMSSGVEQDVKRDIYSKIMHQWGQRGSNPYSDELIRPRLQLLESLGLSEPNDELVVYLPIYSFLLRIPFMLARPYISKDDEPFYIHENPACKEKIFKVPMIRSASWKGIMRWVAGRIPEGDDDWEHSVILTNVTEGSLSGALDLVGQGATPDVSACPHAEIDGAKGFRCEDTPKHRFPSVRNEECSHDDLIRRLFGNEKQSESHLQGRLNFFPTFFDGIDLDVLNPHDRKKRAGTIPITLEVVPARARGTFHLLYCPFDLVDKSEERKKSQLFRDLKLIHDSLEAMMLVYGFSAKRKDGYGVIRKRFPQNGLLSINMGDASPCQRTFIDFDAFGKKCNELEKEIM